MKANYSTPDTKAWRDKCDDLFLAQFRGKQCEICGATSTIYKGRKTRSCFHHLLEKDLHRIHRYNPDLGVILCPEHHGHHSRSKSPHSDDTFAVMGFYVWLYCTHFTRTLRALRCGLDKWDESWTYKEMYVRLGGEITEEKFKKDQRPLNHAEKIRIAEGN